MTTATKTAAPSARPWEAVGREIRTANPADLMPYIVAQTGVYWLTNSDREGAPEANAEFIARAVNAHDDLLAACKKAAMSMADMPHWLEANGAKVLSQMMAEQLEAIRAAIAKATS